MIAMDYPHGLRELARVANEAEVALSYSRLCVPDVVAHWVCGPLDDACPVDRAVMRLIEEVATG